MTRRKYPGIQMNSTTKDMTPPVNAKTTSLTPSGTRWSSYLLEGLSITSHR